MSLAVRVIPCLDVDAGRVVKGVHFENLKDAGDPVELAAEYYRQGADEITFLDVTASSSHRNTMIDVVSRTAEQVFIPMTVGGGVRTPEDVDSLLRCGADKVGVNTAAINDPSLISRVADRFGNQVLVLSVDARREKGEQHTQSGFEVTTMGGRKSTGIDAIWWVKRAEQLVCTSSDIVQSLAVNLYRSVVSDILGRAACRSAVDRYSSLGYQRSRAAAARRKTAREYQLVKAHLYTLRDSSISASAESVPSRSSCAIISFAFAVRRAA